MSGAENEKIGRAILASGREAAMTEQINRRLDRLEADVAVLKTKDAVDTERHANVTKRLETIEGSLKDIHGDNKWVFRLIVGGLILALLNFALKGGLAGVIQ